MAETLTNATVQLSTTSTTTLYQAPNNAATDRAIVLSCLVANAQGILVSDITLALTDANDTVLSYLAFTIVVPADASVELIANKVVLKRGQKLRATASAAGILHATVSALEIA